MDKLPSDRLVLRQCSLPTRLVIAAFLLSVALGYLAAIVQLKMQIASAGEAAPTATDVIEAYAGKTNVCQLERLLEKSDTQPFNGQGSMRSAFTTRAGGLKRALQEKAEELAIDPKDANKQEDLRKAVALDREGERLALVAWAHAGADRDAYTIDSFPLTGDLATKPISTTYLQVDEKSATRSAKIKSIIEDRCVRCHSPNVSGPGSKYPLEKYEDIALYTHAEASTGMSLPKLAQTTHVHLLGFSMLWGLTGLIFAFTSYPGLIRAIIGPWTLVAQIVDISCWWLSRLDDVGPRFAQSIMITGGLVAMGVGLQIVLSLFNMFGWFGKFIVLLLILAGIGGAGLLYEKVIDPYLKSERPMAVAKE